MTPSGAKRNSATHESKNTIDGINTMTMRLVVAAALLLASCMAEEAPLCLSTSDVNGLATKYHNDGLCDKKYHNSNEKRSLRESRYLDLVKTGVSHIPNQLTVTCPEEPVHLEPAHGHDTKWVVENKSSGAAVVAFVSKDGKEYSANNPTISPPQADPNAILKPGDWMALETFEGHVFYVRELLADGSTGNILIQHRPGLIGFKNRFQQEEIDCTEYHDVKPVVEVKPPPKQEKKLIAKPHKVIKTDPKFDRTPEHRGESCNTIYQGFRNLLPNCPLHVYFVGQKVGLDGESQCVEEFKFHLGLEDTTRDYMNDWHDRTKFETTYMGHMFVARLASNPNILVDTFTVLPTEIHDCPSLKQKPIVTQQIIEAKGIQGSVGNQFNVTNLEDVLNTTNVVVDGMRATGSSK